MRLYKLGTRTINITPLVVIALLALAVAVFFTRNRLASCGNWFLDYLRGFPIDEESVQLSVYSEGNQVELLAGGKEILPRLLELVAQSEHSIRFQVMLFNPDEAGHAIADALAAASHRGVDVQLSFHIDQTVNGPIFSPYSREVRQQRRQAMEVMLQALKDSGVDVRNNPAGLGNTSEGLSDEAERLYRSTKAATCVNFNHVDHRKIIIIDDRQAFVQGANVGDEYLYFEPPDLSQSMRSEAAGRRESGLAEAWEKWLDAGVLVSGSAVEELIDLFNFRWEVIGGVPLEPVAIPEGEGDTPVRVLSQRPGDEQVAVSYMELIREAEGSIFIASPFVSYEPALRLLQGAAERGVEVHFVGPGEASDVPISTRIFRSFTPGLLDAGVHVYEANQRMIHAKIMVVDDRWTTVGSFNLNHRSFNHDLELNLVIDDAGFAEQVLEKVFSPYIQLATPLTEPYERRINILEKMVVPFS